MVGPSHAWRSAASSASAFSTSRVLRSRLTPPENFGDLPDAGTVLVRDGLRLAQLVLGRRDQHQGFQALLHPQLLLGLRLRQQASFSSHTQSSAGSVSWCSSESR